MQIHTIRAVPRNHVEITTLTDAMPRLGLGDDAYICDRCQHIVATLGHGSPDEKTCIWIPCSGCDWAVPLPPPADHQAAPRDLCAAG